MSEQPVRTTPDTQTTPDTVRRLDPGKICPGQKTDVTRVVTREIP